MCARPVVYWTLQSAKVYSTALKASSINIERIINLLQLGFILVVVVSVLRILYSSSNSCDLGTQSHEQPDDLYLYPDYINHLSKPD